MHKEWMPGVNLLSKFDIKIGNASYIFRNKTLTKQDIDDACTMQFLQFLPISAAGWQPKSGLMSPSLAHAHDQSTGS